MHPGKLTATLAASIAMFLVAGGMAGAHPPEPIEDVPVHRLHLIATEDGGLALHQEENLTESAHVSYEFSGGGPVYCCYGEDWAKEDASFAGDDFHILNRSAHNGALSLEWYAHDPMPTPFYREWVGFLDLYLAVGCDNYWGGTIVLEEMEGSETFPVVFEREHAHGDESNTSGCSASDHLWAHDVVLTLVIQVWSDYSVDDYLFEEYMEVILDTSGGSWIQLPEYVEPAEPVAVTTEVYETVALDNASSEEPVLAEDARSEEPVYVPGPSFVFGLAGIAAVAFALRRRQL